MITKRKVGKVRGAVVTDSPVFLSWLDELLAEVGQVVCYSGELAADAKHGQVFIMAFDQDANLGEWVSVSRQMTKEIDEEIDRVLYQWKTRS
jgi:hypothetical protein